MARHRQASRRRRSPRRLRMGGYLIITDAAETEKNYFCGLKERIPQEYREDLQMKIFAGQKLEEIIDFAEEQREKDPRFRDVWLVFDRDAVPSFHELIHRAEGHGMKAGWSNPCFEIWLSAYFGSMKKAESSQQCCSQFARLFSDCAHREYKKSDPDLYSTLCRRGDEGQAVQLAQKRYQTKCRDSDNPEDMTACTTVYQLVDEILTKIR